MNLDPLAPQREAAMFYGLFLRGHSAETLRRDIDVPKPVLEKWLNQRRYESNFRDALRRVYHVPQAGAGNFRRAGLKREDPAASFSNLLFITGERRFPLHWKR